MFSAANEHGIPRVIGNYNMKSLLDRGSFSCVWLAKHKFLGTKVAVKVIEKSSLQIDSIRTRFVRELNIIKQMDHPFIAKLYEVLEDEQRMYLVQELAERGSLLKFVNTHGRLDENQARRCFSQLISALEYLHDEKKVCHRDVKAENILLDRNMNLRLIDFGLSRTFDPNSPQLKTACGSPAYAPPEMVRGRSYTKMCDIWSAGIVLYAITVGTLPFGDRVIQRVFQKIAYIEPTYPAYLSPQLIDLLRKILQKNPDSRLTIQKIKQHPWFSQGECLELFKLLACGDEQLLAKRIDQEIVNQIAGLDFNVKGLTARILDGEYNDLTALYYILSRGRVAERVKELMGQLRPAPITSNIVVKATANQAKLTVKHRLASNPVAAQMIGMHRNSDEPAMRPLSPAKRQKHAIRLGNGATCNGSGQWPENDP
jgi:serine/threonine protein kinase